METAWAAGFVDGEGCVQLGKTRTNHIPQLSVVQKFRAPLDRLQRILGGSIFWSPAKGYWHWQIQGQTVASALNQLVPYLTLKREQAELLIMYCHLPWRSYNGKRCVRNEVQRQIDDKFCQAICDEKQNPTIN